jgi:hypothetical protein
MAGIGSPVRFDMSDNIRFTCVLRCAGAEDRIQRHTVIDAVKLREVAFWFGLGDPVERV